MYSAAAVSISLAVSLCGMSAPATQPVPQSKVASVATASAPAPLTFTARFTAEDLRPLFEERYDVLPLPMQLPSQRQAALAALSRVEMGAMIEQLTPWLNRRFGSRFDPQKDLIQIPVPESQQVTLDTPELPEAQYRGPSKRVIGFMLHDVTDVEYIDTAVYLAQTARQLLDSGEVRFDRNAPDHLEAMARHEVQRRIAARKKAEAEDKERQEIRRRVAEALGIADADSADPADAQWAKESRRFTYIVRDGKFIDRLEPLVQRLNREMELAGLSPPSPLDKPGIHFDPDLKDVEIVLPRPIMQAFLEEADRIEQRMAEDHIISIEAVRLTDRDIIDGAIASRLGAQVQGVHDVKRFNTRGVFTQLGLNSLLAVANQQLQVATLEAIESGKLPAGVAPITIASPEMPPLQVDRTATTIGSNFSVGADDIFFDGREQSYGFSYIGPDGIEHRLSLDVVDSLREYWDRIERNLIVHKIKKVDELTPFAVPVGPMNKTYEGIAALISQENQQLVVATGTGAISEIDATAGTWLIIKDFQIAPVPGSSTALTEEELQSIQNRVLLTMFLRDPLVSCDVKTQLLLAEGSEVLATRLTELFESRADQPARPGRSGRTYRRIFEERFRESLEAAAVEKKEQNSTITLSFFSSQGNIISQPGLTQLGDANDLTTFTTELRPNIVTPISSFFTKSGSGAKGTSPLTGISKGERSNEEKTMTHLLIRARFPNAPRERMDREEGRHLGYFQLPITREPSSTVDLPFLSSSDHPAERLARLRVGYIFDALQEERVRRPLQLINPNSLAGTVPVNIWETATTRMLMNRKIISDSPADVQTLGKLYYQRFIVEVRSLLEYDDDFNPSPNFALRNMAQWNDPGRIVLALENSAEKFALQRLVLMIDELGALLVPDEYAENSLAYAPAQLLGGHKLYPLDPDQLSSVRRDAANHFLRFQEAYGDAFLEAVSRILGLGTYRPANHEQMLRAPLRGYHDLALLSRESHLLAEPALFTQAQEAFVLLKNGGRQGGWFEESLTTIEDLPPSIRPFVIRGREILARR
ncbi:MAG TPA: hypothetical protein PL151_03890 [Phycisphaerae bacterium]|nr:hypothetical protein [Phycisphaerae bacterium]HOJ75464.1 hypothetical protein [Phycisphaerae bacterium]HOM52264.1 hypothetical protein [Phycisphaerae bacterium]HON66875.1 hypothetical protein [Phycisphaerae bacterium]HOQ86918.1 hypothetical protein [Phycisphaerae bacterium]